ncbi:GPI-anchored protein [Spatholobus suberectus]|nr:GPI-anchored protein [Spatholobus suberectus]
MLSFKFGLYLLIASVFAFHLLPSPVVCDDEEDDLLRDINTYRKIFNLPVLEKSDKASCLADEIAEDLDDAHTNCEDFRDYYPAPGSNPKIPNFQKSVNKCKININITRDGVIMPVCVPKLDSDALFSNYTKSNRYTKYLNNSKYSVAGIGSEDDWMVLIISTNTSSGDLSSATSLLAGAWSHCLMLASFLSAFIVLFS